MTRFNENFAKFVDGRIEYGPIPLTVIEHHHEEWDEPIIDPETGEPTGESEHYSRDWDTERLAIRPTAVDYRLMGYLPIDYNVPSEPAPEGYHWERRELEPSQDGERMVYRYEAVADPQPTISDFDAAMEAHLKSERDARGYTTREPDSYLTSEVPRWSQDARDWVAHRDAVMGYALELINAVQSGQREPPTMDEFEAGLPVIVWTYTEEA